jgi:hypothetical protein
VRAISKIVFSVSMLIWLSIGTGVVHAELPTCILNQWPSPDPNPNLCCWDTQSGFTCDYYCEYNFNTNGTEGDECLDNEEEPGVMCQCSGDNG